MLVDCYVFYFYFLFCIMCYYVFFFKQKTAYEMRISDWSSDVCSSDLLEIGDVLALPVFQVRETEGAFVIERFDPGYEFDLAMVVRMEPGDRKMTTCADDQLIGLYGNGDSPDDHRFAIGSFHPDSLNQGGSADIGTRSAEHKSELQ